MEPLLFGPKYLIGTDERDINITRDSVVDKSQSSNFAVDGCIKCRSVDGIHLSSIEERKREISRRVVSSKPNSPFCLKESLW
jgi:hypothetical protein